MVRLRVEVKGTAKVIATLQKAKVRMSDFSEAWKRIGGKIQRDAMVLAPVLTGRLARSIRASKSKTRATVRAGRANIPYAGVIHYGGYNNIQAHPFLTTALHANAGYAVNEIQDEIQQIIRQLDLGTFRV